MDYDAVLAQVLELLQREQRLSYRVLKRRLQLDDETLEDLKEDLIYAKKLAMDEDGRVLVWTGGAGTPLAPMVTPSQPPQSPANEADQAAHVNSPSTEPRPPDAERRQLTVLFCDLIDSTALSGQLDPEEWREVVRAYQETCAKVIARYDGHIAQYLGDGLLVYFGYPQAHEDDAQRAVRAGLGIVAAMGQLNTCLGQERGLQLAVRLGIHTGMVVVGDVGGGTRQEQLALGETPNIAARLQSLAAPDQVVISEHTRRLVGATFDLEALGVCALKGVPTPQPVYGVHGESSAESRFEAASTVGVTPLVGREEELGLALRRWAQARVGEGQVVLLTGEPGIGKSRLLQAVRERVAAEPHIRLSYQCSPYHANSAFYPIMAQLERAARFEPGDPPARKLDRLEALLAQGTTRVAEVAPLLAALWSLSTGDRYPPLALGPDRQKAQTVAALVDQMAGLSRRQPVLCLVEDAHWCDPTTIEVLDQLVHRVPELPVLVLITARPEFAAPWAAAHMTTLTLTRLGRTHAATMVAHLTAGRALPSEVLAQILARTDGVPLFVEELTKTILESGLLREVGEHYALTGPLPPLAIPATVQDSLMARIDRLAPVKEVAQLGAVLGREFTYELLAAVASRPEPALGEALAQLVQAGLLFRLGQPPEAHYRFKHALVQDAAYASLLRSRRQALHTHIATVLEGRFPTIVETEPEVVARHYMEAGLSAQAIPYWQRAGQRAIEHSAHVEAVAHLTKGLQVLQTLPDTPERAQQELVFQTTLGPALMATQGFASPDVERAYARARELCRHMTDVPQVFPVLWGLWLFYEVRGALQTARELTAQLLTLAQRQQEPLLLLQAHRAVGQTLLWLGELVPARTYLEESIALYDTQQPRALAFHYGPDPGVGLRNFAAHVLWYLGYPDQALKTMDEALSLARQLSHPFSLAPTLDHSAWLHQYRREGQLTQGRAEADMALSREHGFAFFLAQGTIMRGWGLAEQGQVVEGRTEIRAGLAALQATGAELTRAYWLALLAEACGNTGQVEEGLQLLTEALAAAHTHGSHVWDAELHRLTGELLLRQTVSNSEGAETCFREALEVARRQQAKSLELRAATSLSRLWQQRGKPDEACALLAPIYGWFTEGFDTADLQEAKALLEELS